MTDQVMEKSKRSHLMCGKRKERTSSSKTHPNKVIKKASCENMHADKSETDSWSLGSSCSSLHNVQAISQEDIHNHFCIDDNEPETNISKKYSKRTTKTKIQSPSPDFASTKSTPNKSNLSLVDYSDSSDEQSERSTRVKPSRWSGGSVYSQLNYSGMPQSWLDQSFDSRSGSASAGSSYVSLNRAYLLQNNHYSHFASSESLSLPSSSESLGPQTPPSALCCQRIPVLTPPSPYWFPTPPIPRNSRAPFRKRWNSSGSVEKPRSDLDTNWRHQSPSPIRRSYGHSNVLPLYDVDYAMKLEPGVGIIDTHCHLDFLFRKSNYTDTYAKFKEENASSYPACYEGCVAIFCNPITFHQRSMWENFLDNDGVWAAFGCHPHMVNNYDIVTETYLKEALTHERVVALGEIGLDYSFKNNCNHDMQKEAFRRQLKIAIENQLPLVIHCRDADDDCVAIMKEIVPVDYLIHMHCFTNGWDVAQMWLNAFTNLYLGITALVTFPSAKGVHQVAANIPLNRLLLETDTPYFVPRTVSGASYSHPGMVIHVAAQIAALKEEDITLYDVLKATRENTRKVYGI